MGEGSTTLIDAKNEIKKALAYKRLQKQLQGTKAVGPEELMKLYQASRISKEASEGILITKANEALAQQCPECRRIFGEHSEEELIRCIRE